MANVIVDKNKIDLLANAISAKSGEPLTLTLDEMVEAVDGIETGGGEPNLQAKTLTVSSAGTETVTADAGYDGLSEVEVSVPEAYPYLYYEGQYITQDNNRIWQVRGKMDIDDEVEDHSGYIGLGTYNGNWYTHNAIPTGTTITPSTSSQTIGGRNYMMEGAVTVNPIPSQYIIPSGTKTIDSAGTTDVTNYASVSVPQADPWLEITSEYYTSGNQRMWRATPRVLVDVSEGDTAGFIADGYSKSGEDPLTRNAVASGTTITPSTSAQTVGGSDWVMEGAVTVSAMPTGTEGTPTATKGTVSNHSVTVTPSVTNTAGYISGGSHTGTAVTVSASELVSGTYTVDGSGTADVTNYASISVPQGELYQGSISGSYNFTGDNHFWKPTVYTYQQGYFPLDYYSIQGTNQYEAIPSNTTITPSTSAQTIGGADTMLQGAITVSAMPSGTAGTPTATKSAVSNHSVTVTPSVTNTTGYITGSTKTGTAVTVSASELVSGSETKTENGTYDVTNLAELVVNVSGGGGGTVQVGTKTATLSAVASSIQFTGLSGNPTSFVITSSADVATNTNGVTGVVWDGTNLHGQTMTTQVTADTGFTKSYSSGTLTVTATTAEFQANEYKLVYTYSGSSSDVHTSDVQVGSGATSITFSSLSGRPIYWSCIFKSDFSTSSGYQRVIEVVNDGSSIYGMAMDSSAKAQTSWSATYSGGTLTITSSGTNNGGYFHQPGYYQLTYAVDASAPQYQTKSVSYTPTTSQQTATVYPDSGYDALESVSVTVGAMPTMTLPNSASATSSGTSKATITPTSSVQYLNIPTGYNATAQYYTIGASGGGGGDKNIQISQSTTRNSASTLTRANGDLTVSKTGTYDVYWTASRTNTSTSYTWGSQLYVGGSAYGSENTTWSNNVQNNHLSNVSLTANQKIAVYTRGRSGSYYTYAPMLVIVEA